MRGFPLLQEYGPFIMWQGNLSATDGRKDVHNDKLYLLNHVLQEMKDVKAFIEQCVPHVWGKEQTEEGGRRPSFFEDE